MQSEMRCRVKWRYKKQKSYLFIIKVLAGFVSIQGRGEGIRGILVEGKALLEKSPGSELASCCEIAVGRHSLGRSKLGTGSFYGNALVSSLC